MKAHVFASDERGGDFFEEGFVQFFGLTAREARARRIDGLSDFSLASLAPDAPKSTERRRCLSEPAMPKGSGALGRLAAASFVENLRGSCLSRL